MIPENLIWFVWSLGLVAIWLVVYILRKDARKRMLWASILTTPFGLTEPLFVPEYWNPPSLFDLAQRTGFDIESLIFCFGIGGLGVVMYDLIFKVEHVEMDWSEKHSQRHRLHFWTLISPVLIFLPLHIWTSMNPIYSSGLAMFFASLAALWCRPDLKKKIWIGGLIFMAFYFVYFFLLDTASPGYVDRVWTLGVLSGIRILNVPIEELLFAFTFGMLWSSYYEHLTWHKLQPAHAGKGHTG